MDALLLSCFVFAPIKKQREGTHARQCSRRRRQDTPSHIYLQWYPLNISGILVGQKWSSMRAKLLSRQFKLHTTNKWEQQKANLSIEWMIERVALYLRSRLCLSDCTHQQWKRKKEALPRPQSIDALLNNELSFFYKIGDRICAPLFRGLVQTLSDQHIQPANIGAVFIFPQANSIVVRTTWQCQ